MSEKYEILARKYRPKTFEEVVGQKAVVQTIQNAIKTGRIAQAYLFSGVRGTGKTTVARILAKALNCASGPTPHPDNRCEFCTAINEDRAIDVLEIDGASNRGIDEIRALRESLKYKAIYTRYKVVIIDEVHQITKDGFNALLKTLEEPPPNTVFIFATTEFHKVMPTIVSRCQHFEFRKISHKDIINHLMEITRKERDAPKPVNITITPAGLSLIAEAADGSMRDAESLLDQAVAFSGENISDEDLKIVLGAIGEDVLFGVSSAVLEERPEAVFPLVDDIVTAGYDLRFFFSKLIEHFRALLLVSTVARPEDLLLVNPEELQALRTQAAKAGAEDFLRYLLALQQGEPGLKYSAQPRIYLEAFLVKLCQFRKLVPLKDLIRDVDVLRKGDAVRGGSPAPGGPGPQGGRPGGERGGQPGGGAGTAGRERPSGAPAGTARTRTGPDLQPPSPQRAAAPAGPAATGTPSPPAAKEIFRRILTELGKERGPLAALMGQFTSARLEDDLIEVFFESGKGFFGTAIQEKDVKAVEKAASDVLGRAVRVRFSEEKRAGIPPVPGREPEAVLKDPAVRFFMDTFKAQVVSVDPVKSPKDRDAEGGGSGENGA